MVVSYNVENLFDTINAPGFDDDEFTPGEKKWTYERYEKKLTDLARVILSIPEKELPGTHWSGRSRKPGEYWKI